MTYTFIFGIYSSVILIKCQNIISSIILHSYCNIMEVPRFSKIFKSKNEHIKFSYLLNYYYFFEGLIGVYLIGILLFFVNIIYLF